MSTVKTLKNINEIFDDVMREHDKVIDGLRKLDICKDGVDRESFHNGARAMRDFFQKYFEGDLLIYTRKKL